jgi:hypothetical protein
MEPSTRPSLTASYVSISDCLCPLSVDLGQLTDCLWHLVSHLCVEGDPLAGVGRSSQAKQWLRLLQRLDPSIPGSYPLLLLPAVTPASLSHLINRDPRGRKVKSTRLVGESVLNAGPSDCLST